MNNYRALEICDFFIKKGVSPLKLQKLLFYAQIWNVVKNNELLFKEDTQAWVLGPVVYEVWDNFRFIRRGDKIPDRKLQNIDFDQKTEAHLKEIWDIYGHYSGLELVDLTHQEPLWIDARGNTPHQESSTAVISINKLTTSYLKLENKKIPQPKMKVEGIAEFRGKVGDELF